MHSHWSQVALSALLVAMSVAKAESIDSSRYAHSFTVKFPGYVGASTLTDFPVLVRLSKELNDFRYGACRVKKGGDLRFALPDGTLLASEVDTWDENGTSLVWVKVPSFNADTKIVAHYGCATPAAVNASDVWSNGYLGVWHLGASDVVAQKNSATNAFDLACDASASNMVVLVADGAIGGSVGFNRDSSKMGSLFTEDPEDVLAGSGDLSLEAWIYPTSVETDSNRAILSKRKDYSKTTYYIHDNKSGPPTMTISTGPTNNTTTYLASPSASDTPGLNKWTYLVYTRSGTDRVVRCYLDGTNTMTATEAGDSGSLYKGGGYSFVVGNDRPTSSVAYPGNIDEVRVSGVARSADWVRATRDCVQEEDFAIYEADNDWTKYTHRFQISFTGYVGDETLEDFPVLVRISESGIPGFRYSDLCKPDGGDLHFADAAGEILDYEVDTWNTNGVSLVWVKVPALAAASEDSATKITAYYGWCLAPPNFNSTNVWDNGFLGVWHMNDLSYEMCDATGGGSSFREDGNTFGTSTPGCEGAVGYSVQFSQGENGGGMRNDSSRIQAVGASAFSVELWSFQDDHDPGEATREQTMIREVTTDNSTYPNTYRIYESASTGNKGKTVVVCGFDSGDLYATPSIDKPLAPRAAWNHHAAVYRSSSGARVFLNGLLTASLSCTGNLRASLGKTVVTLANNTTSQRQAYFGKIDEVRISGVARSDAWVKASHDTIADSAFATYGEVRKNIRRGFRLFVR